MVGNLKIKLYLVDRYIQVGLHIGDRNGMVFKYKILLIILKDY